MSDDANNGVHWIRERIRSERHAGRVNQLANDAGVQHTHHRLPK
jgi:hypothetical protein